MKPMSTTRRPCPATPRPRATLTFVAAMVLGLGGLQGCRSTAPSANSNFEELFQQEIAGMNAKVSREGSGRQTRDETARRERVLELIEAGELRTPMDGFHAAAILRTSGELDVLTMAQDLAFDAAEAGIDEGLPLAAEIIDRGLMIQQLPQMYATQYAYDPINNKWYLWDLDPTVTDADREYMGVPSVADALLRLNRLNDPAALEAIDGR